MSDGTTNAWLEEARADVDAMRKSTRTIDHARAAAEAADRVANDHAPAMLLALATIAALPPGKSYRPAWEEGYAACLRDVHEVINEARSST